MTTETDIRTSSEYLNFKGFVEKYLEEQNVTISDYPTPDALQEALSEAFHYEAADEDVNIDIELSERRSVLVAVWEDLSGNV